MKRPALDWFEAGIDIPDEAGQQYFLMIIKKLLNLKAGGSSRFYEQSYINEDIGFTLQFQLKEKLQNKPLFIRLTGAFFTDPRSEETFNTIIDGIHASGGCFRPNRVDGCIDLISTVGDVELPCIDIIKVNHKSSDLKAVINYDTGQIETVFAGKSDYRLRVYNKLLECPEFTEKYGLDYPVFDVWRIESQVRGVLLSDIFYQEVKHYSVGWYQFFLWLSLSQITQRYSINNHQIVSSDTKAFKRKRPTLNGSAQYWADRRDKAQRAYDAVCSISHNFIEIDQEE